MVLGLFPQLRDVIEDPGSLHFATHFPKHVGFLSTVLVPLGHEVAAYIQIKGNAQHQGAFLFAFPFSKKTDLPKFPMRLIGQNVVSCPLPALRKMAKGG